MNELDIFSAALDLTIPDDREHFLDEACREHPELRKRIDLLLHNAACSSQFLESAAPGIAATIDQPTEQIGTFIGPYKLREQLGEGGMGFVYVAEQEQPVRRKVALKIIKPGMDTRQVIARFAAEHQALAMMDHPNIARIIDAGTTESDRPYFVMELVRGVPITDFCDQHGLDTRQRLEIFIQVCRAIQHAHQKGIIHRDIKPSNVLVTLHDDKPVPKVIDFGVAKATTQAPNTGERHSIYTGFAQMLGTPLYMSPEQAELNALDVDTRSDVYSLGVLLYELLTGTTPFDKERLKSAGFDELRRIIREEEPETVSMRLTKTRNAFRGRPNANSNPKSQIINPKLNELDWIVAHSLEKDRTRRYESAAAFAADIQRYLNDEPVQACPPSAAYRLRKFARRNTTVITTAALVTLTVLIGLFASVWQATRATRAEGVADRNYREAQREAKAAKTAQREAVAQSERSEQLRVKAEEGFRIAADSVDKMVLTLTEERLATIPQLQDTRKELFEDAVTLFDRVIQLDPGNSLAHLQRGQAHQALEHADHVLSDYQEAIELDPTNHRAHFLMAVYYNTYPDFDRRDYQEALKHINAAVDLAPTVPLYQIIRARIVARTDYARALRYFEDIVRLAPTYPRIYWARATMEHEHEDFAAALADAEIALELAPEQCESHQSRGCALMGLGRLDEALQELDRAKSLAPYNPYVYSDRGTCLFRMGRYQEALADFTTHKTLAPKHFFAYKRSAAANFELQQYMSALDDLRTAIRLMPTDLSTLTWIPLAKVASCPDATFREGFLKLTNEAVELNKDGIDARLTRALILAELGQPAQD